MDRSKNGRFKRTIKELSQFNNKNPEELESEFGRFCFLPRNILGDYFRSIKYISININLPLTQSLQ